MRRLAPALLLICAAVLALLPGCASEPATAPLPKVAPAKLSTPAPRANTQLHTLNGQLHGTIEGSTPVDVELAILMLDERGKPVALLDSEAWFGDVASPFQLALDPQRLPPSARLQLRVRVTRDSRLLAYVHHELSQPLPRQLPPLRLQVLP